MQVTHGLRAVLVVAQHKSIKRAVHKEARHAGDTVLPCEYGLILVAETGHARRFGQRPLVEDQHGVLQKVREDLREQVHGALHVGGEARRRAVETDDEHVHIGLVADHVHHVLDVLHVALIAARVRQALGVDEAQLEAVVASEESTHVSGGQLGLGGGALADAERVLARQHVQQRALAYARVAQHDHVEDTLSMRMPRAH